MIKRKITQKLERMREDGGKHYKRHRALKRLLADPEYEIGESIVFNDETLTVEGGIRYMPIYMCMFLEKGSMPENLIYDVGAPV